MYYVCVCVVHAGCRRGLRIQRIDVRTRQGYRHTEKMRNVFWHYYYTEEHTNRMMFNKLQQAHHYNRIRLNNCPWQDMEKGTSHDFLLICKT